MQTQSTSLALGLLALAAPGALAAEVTDLRIQLVDGQQRPIDGIELSIYDTAGLPLFTTPDGSSGVVTQTDADAVILVLPELGTSLTVPLSGALGHEITVRVSTAKGAATLGAVKPFSPGIAFGAPGAPANDDCANALPIAAGDTAFSTVGASTDSTLGTNNNDIWYVYTSPGNGVATFSTCNAADFDTDLVLLTADSTCGAQAALAINDDAAGCAGNTTILNAGVEAGQTYLLSVGAFGAGGAGTGTLSVSFVEAAANDSCDGAEQITLGTPVTFSNAASTTSASDPLFSCIFGGPGQGFGSTWFRFTADGSSVQLDTSDSMGSNDTVVGVYSGDCGNLIEVACGEDIDFDGLNFLTQVIATGLTAGTEYLVQVSTFNEAAAGEITLAVNTGPSVTPYFGSGVNTATLTMPLPALIGETLELNVSPGTGATIVGFSLTPAQFLLDPFGEVLINLAPYAQTESLNGNHVAPIPDNSALIGRTFYAQGLVVGTNELTNGVEFVLGGF